MRIVNFVLASMLMLVIHSANAVMISYSSDFSTYSTSDFGGSPDTQNVGLTGFDSGLGTLTGVSIDFTSTYNVLASAWGYNYGDGGVNSEILAQGQYDINLNDPASASLSMTSLQYSVYCSTYDPSCSASVDSGLLAYNGSLDVSGIDLNAFVKATNDTIDLAFVNTLDSTEICFGLGVSSDYDCDPRAATNWLGTVTINYEYDAAPGTGGTTVPEPGSVALLAMGLAGLGFSRRQRKHVARGL